MNCKNCKLVLSCTVATNEENIECGRYVKKPILKSWSTGLPKFGKGEMKDVKRK